MHGRYVLGRYLLALSKQPPHGQEHDQPEQQRSDAHRFPGERQDAHRGPSARFLVIGRDLTVSEITVALEPQRGLSS
jgi:hypothetical protein